MNTTTNYLIILVAIMAILIFAFCIIMPIVKDEAIIHSTYEEGYEISHMETAGKHFVLSARNDNNSFSIAVDANTYARFCVGELIHVKVTIYEKDGHYTKSYEIMGREGYTR